MQVSKVVQKFYECLMRGEEYTDDAWDLWEKNHPADVAARSPQKSGAAMGGGRGNCFKYVPPDILIACMLVNHNVSMMMMVIIIISNNDADNCEARQSRSAVCQEFTGCVSLF